MSATFLHIFQYQKYFKRNINANRILRNQYQIILIGISHDGGILKENKSINKNTIHLKNQNLKKKKCLHLKISNMLVILPGSYLSAINGKWIHKNFFFKTLESTCIDNSIDLETVT